MVGKNASGKTRILNIISSLAGYLAGLRPLARSGNFDVTFTDEKDTVCKYLLRYEDQKVVQERYSINEDILLDRTEGGEGTIFAKEVEGGKKIRFQTPPSELAAVARRDTIQHVFLEPLYVWGSSLRHYRFGSSLGKEHLAIFNATESKELNERNPNNVIHLYKMAHDEFGEAFEVMVKKDMARIDYDIENIGLAPPISFRFPSEIPGEAVYLYVKEKDLPGNTDQNSMSQGMFRALSILIQVNYSQMAKKAACILIDDIGEGLDFDRSCKLISLLREKASGSNIQLVLSTNDRFVMNDVPLEDWSVIQRRGGCVNVRNYENSREVFEDFKYTGLSNFSFLELDYVNEKETEEYNTDE